MTRFNGASLFRARKRAVSLHVLRKRILCPLQWGLTLSSEETGWIRHELVRPHGYRRFNGASLFRARKRKYRRRSKPTASRMQLQWGLTLSSEETELGTTSVSRRRVKYRFNGASLFRARKHGRVESRQAPAKFKYASMGPHSFERGNGHKLRP